MVSERTELQKIGIVALPISVVVLLITLWEYVRGIGPLSLVFFGAWLLFSSLSSQFGETKTSRTAWWLMAISYVFIFLGLLSIGLLYM